ncbi:hypothetical protein ASG25_13345 [Rhizobium sp. Leaf384]|uniref:hypothetical protein n=1 Tax=Rhizobium sp. Leaf384 TaxID=1736358 RepID=UPI0007143618|nr:hypothetical protein [Rhizobium sp. Leaf384]KQS79494.1 hypothetical protein ASG25_13345 [Rhizobium sp. Leaf384]
MEGWTVVAAAIADAGGRGRRPAIVVTAASNLDDVRNVRVQVRVAATDTLVFDSDNLPYDAPYSWTLSGAWLLPATVYEVRGRLIAQTASRQTLWSTWLTVTTPNLLVIAEDILDNAITQQKIIDGAISAQKIMDAAITALKLADKAVTTNKLAIGAVTKDILASGAIVADKFADGLGPVGIISGAAVPTTKTTEVITVAGKLYRWNGNKYTADVPAADIAGTISGSQIADEALDATKFANGLSPVTNVSGSTVPTTKSTDVITVAGKLYRWTGSAYSASVPTQDLTGTVSANQIAANSITSSKIAADAITTAHIQAGAVKADQIAANAITAKQLTLMDMGNLVLNGDFSQLDAGWTGTGGWDFFIEGTASSSVNAFARKLVNAAGTFNLYQDGQWAVNPGEEYYIEAWTQCSGSGGAVANLRLQLQFQDTNATASAYVRIPDVAINGTKGWSKTMGSVVVPATVGGNPTVKARFWAEVRDVTGANGGSIRLGKVFVRRMNNAELIVDGAITGDKITANAISSDKIAANAITSDKISANAITASKIAAGSIDTDKLAANAITADKLDANAVTAQKIAAGAITAIKIGAGAVTTDKLDADAVTADKIAANSIGARHIAADSITARNLLLTDFSNMVPDNALQDIKSWSLGGGSATPYFTVLADIGPAMRFTGTVAASSGSTYIAGATSKSFNVRPGDELRFGATIDFNSDSDNQGVRIYLNFYDASGNNVGNPSYNEPSAVDLSVRNVAQNATVPAGAVTAQLYIRRQVPTAGATSGGSLNVWNPFCYRRANAELIVDGAITAAKIAANSITADKIAANAVTVDKIAANAVTADKINVVSLAAISATLGNVDISNANIGTLTVGKSNIQSGAVTQVDSYYSSSTLGLTQSSNIEVADVTVTVAAGEKVLIFGQFRIDMESSTRASVAARIYRNGAATGMNMSMDCPLLYEEKPSVGGSQYVPAVYGWRGMLFVVMLQDTPGTGTFTYTLRAIRDTGGGQDASTNLRFLTALVTKR